MREYTARRVGCQFPIIKYWAANHATPWLAIFCTNCRHFEGAEPPRTARPWPAPDRGRGRYHRRPRSGAGQGLAVLGGSAPSKCLQFVQNIANQGVAWFAAQYFM